jgi:hypothetical protein
MATKSAGHAKIVIIKSVLREKGNKEGKGGSEASRKE